MRYPSVDILRSIAIVVMVLVHFAENLSGVALPFSGLGAPLFAILSGISYRLWVNGQERREVSDELISKVSIRRGLFVFAVGFAFNIFVWLPEDMFNWDVLTFIGFAILILNQVRHLPVTLVILIASLVFLMTPFLQAMADYPSYWTNHYFEVDLTLPDVIIGFLVTGYFPIFPWLTYSLVGYSTAVLLFPHHLSSPEEDRPPSIFPLLGIGATLLIVANITLQLRSYLPELISKNLLVGWTMFPASLEYITATIAMALLLLGLLHHFIDRNPALNKESRLFHLFKVFSRNAFTIYLLHHMVHLWPLWIYGYSTGNETTFYWRNAMSMNYSMPLAVLFLVLCYLILSRIDPDKRYGVEGWMRWLCD